MTQIAIADVFEGGESKFDEVLCKMGVVWRKELPAVNLGELGQPLNCCQKQFSNLINAFV